MPHASWATSPYRLLQVITSYPVPKATKITVLTMQNYQTAYLYQVCWDYIIIPFHIAHMVRQKLIGKDSNLHVFRREINNLLRLPFRHRSLRARGIEPLKSETGDLQSPPFSNSVNSLVSLLYTRFQTCQSFFQNIFYDFHRIIWIIYVWNLYICM